LTKILTFWAICGLALSMGCSPSTSSRTPARTLVPAELPDLTQLANESVSSQLRAQFDSLARDQQNPSITPKDLGAAFGKMGVLLFAADYSSGSEPFLANAQALAPEEIRWPYFLGRVYLLQGDTTKAITSLERAVKLRPDDQATLIWLGRANLEANRLDAADQLFRGIARNQELYGAAYAQAKRPEDRPL